MAKEAIHLLFDVEGGDGIDAGSGKLIVTQLTEIIKKINDGKNVIPKVKIDFDMTETENKLKDIKKQIKDVAKALEEPSGGSGKSGGEKNTSAKKSRSSEQKNRISLIKDYYKARIELEKIVRKSDDVIKKDGSFETTGEKYKLLVERVNQLKTAYDALGLSVEDNRFKKIVNDNGDTISVPNENFGHSEAYKNANGDLEKLKETAKKLNLTTEEYIELIQTAENAVRDLAAAEDKDSTEKRWANNVGKAATLLEDLEGKRAGQRDTGVGKLMNELRELSRSGDISNLDKLTQKMDEVRIAAAKAGVDVDTWGTKMLKTLGGKLRSALAGFAVGKASQYLREVYQNVVELDSAITDLQIASGKTREETEHLIKSYSKLGKEIGATTIEVAKSADTFLRQGYSIEQTETLIKNAMMLSKLGQIESAEAARALTSAMKGYKVEVEDTIGIVDKFTAVDMKAAVSAGDIATAMAETATGADIAGVSMDKLVGYIATVSEVTQDGAESVGK